MATPGLLKTYKVDRVSLQHNKKTGEAGTIDIFRGCPGCEMKNAPCYAAKGAARVGIDFFQPIRRVFDKSLLEKQLKRYEIDWVRIGCISDPSLDWETTCEIAELIDSHGKKPVIITKLYEIPSNQQLERLARTTGNLQVSVSGVTPRKTVGKRFAIAQEAHKAGLSTAWRINSARWKPDSKADKVQESLIYMADEEGLPIIDTPIRLFKTSPFWAHVDQEKYHRHLSPISGKLDNQRTAGLIIPEAYACYSTCADRPKGNDPIGCPHQCLTRT